MPDADVWMCRDCLFHFSDRNIWRALQNFLQSDINYLLTTTFPESTENRNIATGDFRPLNLELPPFSFPSPIAQLDDWIEGHPVKKLALWERAAPSVTHGEATTREAPSARVTNARRQAFADAPTQYRSEKSRVVIVTHTDGCTTTAAASLYGR